MFNFSSTVCPKFSAVYSANCLYLLRPKIFELKKVVPQKFIKSVDKY
jgi:hypothetical protein